MSEVNIDADLVREGGAGLSQTEERLVEMSNGCICCTLRDDLLTEVRRPRGGEALRLSADRGTGIPSPCPSPRPSPSATRTISRWMTSHASTPWSPSSDALNLLADYDSRDFLADRGETAGDGDGRTLVDLLVEQIEFADVVVINKIGEATPEQREKVRQVVRGLNADARIVEVDFGRVPLGAVLGYQALQRGEITGAPALAQGIVRVQGPLLPETEEYGIRSFVYRARRPFHPQKLYDLLGSALTASSAQGPFLAGDAAALGRRVFAGRSHHPHRGHGQLVAAVPKERWPRSEEFASLMRRHWSPTWGDRRQELVFIGGPEMDEAAIRAALDACLTGSPATGCRNRCSRSTILPVMGQAGG